MLTEHVRIFLKDLSDIERLEAIRKGEEVPEEWNGTENAKNLIEDNGDFMIHVCTCRNAIVSYFHNNKSKEFLLKSRYIGVTDKIAEELLDNDEHIKKHFTDDVAIKYLNCTSPKENIKSIDRITKEVVLGTIVYSVAEQQRISLENKEKDNVLSV